MIDTNGSGILLCFRKKFGFGLTFRKWVDILLKSSISAIQTNGLLSSFFPITRSIKQDSPIACLLYVICYVICYQIVFKLNQWRVASENATLFRELISLLYKVTYYTKKHTSVNMSMMHIFLRKTTRRYLVCLTASGAKMKNT